MTSYPLTALRYNPPTEATSMEKQPMLETADSDNWKAAPRRRQYVDHGYREYSSAEFLLFFLSQKIQVSEFTILCTDRGLHHPDTSPYFWMDLLRDHAYQTRCPPRISCHRCEGKCAIYNYGCNSFRIILICGLWLVSTLCYLHPRCAFSSPDLVYTHGQFDMHWQDSSPSRTTLSL